MEDKVVYALGFFDGVHLGHQALLRECAALAEDLGCKAGAVTFVGHPDVLVHGQPMPLINTASDRRALLRRWGVEDVVELPFDRRLMTMGYATFFRMLLARYGAGGLVCGQDFRFGHRGEGDAEKLQALCAQARICCRVVEQIRLDGVVVSSTHIRRLIADGDMEAAARFLGHRHILTGIVVPGHHLGRTLGIPTANLVPPRDLLLPRGGVYICQAAVAGERFPAVTNVGTRPTVGGRGTTVETWILGLDRDLYGQELELEFCAFLRPERKFASVRELQAQIRENGEQARKYFEKS